MTVTEAGVRDRYTDPVFERGTEYLVDGRIERLSRFEDTVRAVVSGGQDYQVRVDLSLRDFDPHCTSSYDGQASCRHVVAVLLELAREEAEDESHRIEVVLKGADVDRLRGFLRDEFCRDPSMGDRVLARVEAPTNRSFDEMRTEIDRLFEETNPDLPIVFDQIDSTEFSSLAEEHGCRTAFRAVATIYRALVVGIDENTNLVGGGYDHYTLAFRRALDGYVEAVSTADLEPGELDTKMQVLIEKRRSRAPHRRTEFRQAAAAVEARTRPVDEAYRGNRRTVQREGEAIGSAEVAAHQRQGLLVMHTAKARAAGSRWREFRSLT